MKRPAILLPVFLEKGKEMKKKRYKKLQSVLACVFAFVLLVTSVQTPTLSAAEKKERAAKLVNLAPESEITVPSSEGSKVKENLVDGDDNSLWVQNGETWPSKVEFKLPSDNTKKIKKVIVKFEKGHTPWSVDVGRILRTFKIKKNVEVTDNGKIII